MNPNTLRLITAIIGICTLISGLGAYADIIPPHYFKIFGLIMIAAVSIKEWAVRVGDLADDGQLNGSFKPEQPKQPNSKPWMSVLLFATSVLLCGCYLTSCSNVAQEALKRRAEEAALEVGKQATVVGVEGTLNWLRKELKTLEAKPIDEDPYQQLIDQNRISALKAAIKSGEEQLVKLREKTSAQSSVLSAQLNPTAAVVSPILTKWPYGQGCDPQSEPRYGRINSPERVPAVASLSVMRFLRSDDDGREAQEVARRFPQARRTRGRASRRQLSTAH